jgi:O-antigen/teichoic acid export membrane protein
VSDSPQGASPAPGPATAPPEPAPEPAPRSDALVPPVDPAPAAGGRFEGRFSLRRGVSLRHYAARGTIINAVFLLSLSLLGVVRNFLIAIFLTTRAYGIWGILVVSLGTLVWLKQVGISDKYVQQDDADQEVAFQRAFTLEAIFSAAFVVLMLAAIPVIAIAYGQTAVIAPGLVLILVVPAVLLQSPLWIFYRRMDFVRQRRLQAADPIMGFVVAIVLAAIGAGYWSLVAATVAGAWTAGLVTQHASPYRIRWRYDRRTARRYVSFSWPLFLAGLSGTLIAQASILVSERHLGLAAAGAVTLASTVTSFAQRADDIVTSTLYPAICAVRDRTDLLRESFVKSNRLAIMWAVPFGIALTLFAPDVVTYVIGEKWRSATVLLQEFGAVEALGHIGFNWDSYFRAKANTGPLGVTAAVMAVVFGACAIPLLLTHGLDGFGAGMLVVILVSLAMRGYYLNRLFAGFNILRHLVRAIWPTLIATVPVLLLRMAEPRHRTLLIALGEVAVYVGLTIVATIVLEGPLLGEAGGYLRRRALSASAAEPV